MTVCQKRPGAGGVYSEVQQSAKTQHAFVSDREHRFEAAMNPTLIYSWQNRLRLKEGVAALGLLARRIALFFSAARQDAVGTNQT